jgi:hypothetical protein
LNDANLMAGLHAGDTVDTKPAEKSRGVESLGCGQGWHGLKGFGVLHTALPKDARGAAAAG